jgi:hypothetical protein
MSYHTGLIKSDRKILVRLQGVCDNASHFLLMCRRQQQRHILAVVEVEKLGVVSQILRLRTLFSLQMRLSLVGHSSPIFPRCLL